MGMNLKECKNCGAQVKKKSITCPKCKAVLDKKSYSLNIVLLVIIVPLFSLLCFAETPQDKGIAKPKIKHEVHKPVKKPNMPAVLKETKAEVEPESEPELPFTVERFIERYNQALKTMAQDWSLKRTSEIVNPQGTLSVQTQGRDDMIGVVLFANKDTRKLNGFIFVGTGNGSPESGLDVLLGLTASIMAIENPQMSKADRKDIYDSIISRLNEKILNVKRDSVKYSFVISKTTGTMLAAEALD